jgi:hypothetical protein
VEIFLKYPPQFLITPTIGRALTGEARWDGGAINLLARDYDPNPPGGAWLRSALKWRFRLNA